METNSNSKIGIVHAAFLLTAHFASATVYFWTNGASGSASAYWSNPTNWIPQGVPGLGDSVVFTPTNGTVAPGPGLNVVGGGQSQINIANFNGMVDANFGGSICSMLCSNIST